MTLRAIEQNDGRNDSQPLKSTGNALHVTSQPLASTASGVQRYDFRAAASTNATVIKASAGRLFGVKVFNYAAGARFIRFYDKATAPTVGTDVPFLMLNVGAGAVGVNSIEMAVHGMPFLNGIAISVTAAQALLDATACSADDVLGAFLYV